MERRIAWEPSDSEEAIRKPGTAISPGPMIDVVRDRREEARGVRRSASTPEVGERQAEPRFEQALELEAVQSLRFRVLRRGWAGNGASAKRGLRTCRCKSRSVGLDSSHCQER
jgi:hypothetical protein